MKKVLLGLITLTNYCALAQIETPVSVYGCSAYSSPTQAEIYAEPNYIRSCIDLNDPGNYTFNYNNDILLQSFSSIHIDPNTQFHAGPFTGVGNTHLKVYPTAPPFDVAVMNNIDMNHVPKLQKLELGIQLPGAIYAKVYNFINNANVLPKDKLNPFVDWDIDIEATFTNGITTKVIDGFFYRNFSRDTSTNDWEDIGTDYPFRIRFAPPTTGNWECQINIKIGGVVTNTSTNFWFNVIDLGAHGYVKVHDNERNLELDGEIIYPVGHNFPYPTEHKREFPNNDGQLYTHKAMTVTGWQAYHQDLIDYHESGGRFIRISQGAASSLIEFEKKGNYYDRLHYAWETDQYIKYCDDNNILVNFNLLFQEPLMRYGQYGEWKWDFSHYMPADGGYCFPQAPAGEIRYCTNDVYPAYCYNDVPINTVDATSLQSALNTDESPHNMFTDENDLKYHEQRMRYYIARYGYSTSIMQFELLSESWHLDEMYDHGQSLEAQWTPEGNIVRNALYNYNQRLTAYIKNTLDHTEHLLGLHAYNTLLDANNNLIPDLSCSIGTIDVVGTSQYKNEPDRLFISGEEHIGPPSVNEKSYYNNAYEISSAFGKPFMYYEQGVVGDNYDGSCTNNHLHKQDMKTVSFTGCAGLFAWEGFTPDKEVMWPYTINAEKWMNSTPVINVLAQNNGGWIQGRQIGRHHLFETDLKEIQYYVDSQGKHAVGAINNRTYNYWTHNVSANCPEYSPPFLAEEELRHRTDILWNTGPDPLFVHGLESNSNYRVRYYDFITDDLIETECYETGLADTKIKMKHPMIDGDEHPVLWFTVDKENCNPTSLAQSNQEATERIAEGLIVDNESTENNSVSPNPFVKELSIQVIEDAEFVIYSGNYEKVYSGKVSSGGNQLNLEFLSRGVYFLKLSTSDKMYKIVKI